MALKDTMNQLHKLLQDLSKDLQKAARGNKAASQRIRTGTIHLEKVAKRYRKESISAEKSGKFKKPRKTAKKKTVRKKTAARKKRR